MKTPPRISDAEWQVMRVLWKHSPQSAQEIIDALAPTTAWTGTTIKTLLNRLMGKGALKHTKEGKAYLYSPAVSKEACRRTEADSFLHRVFDGALSPMLAHFITSGKLSGKELAELEGILKGKKNL
ncbi:MAG: BlaI/MecI/CopY family transcriptional regulator [Chthoniobacterales bacterium]